MDCGAIFNRNYAHSQPQGLTGSNLSKD
ncbi:MAG: hypothetical protein RI892_503, partial [Pseudomonadota bacterium]